MRRDVYERNQSTVVLSLLCFAVFFLIIPAALPSLRPPKGGTHSLPN